MQRSELLHVVTLVGLFVGVLMATGNIQTVRADGLGLDPLLIQDQGLAPELTNNVWINSNKPLRLADLHGQVVLLEFWTFNCINCQDTLPYLKQAYSTYQKQGVQFIGIHYPETSYERDVNNVKDFVKQQGITYPVAIDNDGVTWNAYEMHAWPAFIIIDKMGHIRYRQIGEGNYATISKVLDSLVAESLPDGGVLVGACSQN